MNYDSGTKQSTTTVYSFIEIQFIYNHKEVNMGVSTSPASTASASSTPKISHATNNEFKHNNLTKGSNKY